MYDDSTCSGTVAVAATSRHRLTVVIDIQWHHCLRSISQQMSTNVSDTHMREVQTCLRCSHKATARNSSCVAIPDRAHSMFRSVLLLLYVAVARQTRPRHAWSRSQRAVIQMQTCTRFDTVERVIMSAYRLTAKIVHTYMLSNQWQASIRYS